MTWLSYSDPRTRAVYHRLPRPLQDAAATAYGWRLRRQVRGAAYHRYRRLLDTSQWYDERQFADLQAALLSRFVRHAYAEVPHWRRVFDEAGLDPRSVAHLGDLSCLPLLTKADVRRFGPELVAAGYKRRGARAVSMMTSGSTGTTLEVIWSRECRQREYAFRDQHRAWKGAEDRARIVSFSPKALLPPGQTEPPFWRRSRAENRTFFSVHRMTEMSLPFYVDEVVRLRPQLVTGPPAALALFSRYLIANHLDGVTPVAVSTHEETLYPFQREVIEKAFRGHAFCWYGNAEASANIVECEHGRLHVRPEYSVVELLRADGSSALPGETAEIVASGFGNAAMPLLRYRTGDTVVVAEEQRCACGRRMPVVEALVGRLEDALWTADGHMVTRLDSAFKYSPHVVEAQLFQAEPGAVEVRLVTELGYTKSEQLAIRRELALRFGPSMAIRFRHVESIPRDPSGKFRFVLSQVEVQ